MSWSFRQITGLGVSKAGCLEPYTGGEDHRVSVGREEVLQS